MSNQTTEVTDKEAKMNAIGLDRTAYSIAPNAIPQFTQYDKPQFNARYAVVNSDIVFHFFLPDPVAQSLQTADSTKKQKWNKFWLEEFPAILGPTAKEYFMADYPKVVAKYTEEEASWWFCARGFGTTMSPSSLACGFLDKLSEAFPQPQ